MSDPDTESPTPLDLERAMVFLETHGSTTYPPEKWNKWRYAVTDYAPEWIPLTDLSESRDEFIDRDSCVTVLDFSLSEPEAPEGWERVYQYPGGEHSCPYCGDGTGEESNRAECKLCEGDGLLYWGEECQVVIFAPREESDEDDEGPGDPES